SPAISAAKLAVLLLPDVERPCTAPHLTPHIRCRRAAIDSPQRVRNLLVAEPRSLHCPRLLSGLFITDLSSSQDRDSGHAQVRLAATARKNNCRTPPGDLRADSGGAAPNAARRRRTAGKTIRSREETLTLTPLAGVGMLSLERSELFLHRRGDESQVSLLNHCNTGACLCRHRQGIDSVDL